MKGRFRPAEAYARLWLYDFYHASTLKKEDLTRFHAHSSSSLDFLWSLNFLGSNAYAQSPLFWIGSADLKKLIGLTPTQDRFNFQELKSAMDHKKGLEVNSSIQVIFSQLKEFEQLWKTHSTLEDNFRNRLIELQENSSSPREISQVLEQEFPLSQRLKNAGSLFRSLPSRYREGDWLPINALKIQSYQPSSQSLQYVGNFTAFSDPHFSIVRQAYLKLEKAFEASNEEEINVAQEVLGNALLQAYDTIAGSAIQKVHGKELIYPTLFQLKIETIYVQYPWIPLLLFVYGVGICAIFITSQKKFSKGFFLGFGIISFAVILHTLLLLMRCCILGRPPVTNMFETVIYVPWITSCVSLIFPVFRKNPLALLAACLTSMILLVIIQVTDLNQSLDQVQAVLDSQFWLFIHVLLVVGSYGVFILGAVIGHFYLILFIIHREETSTMKQLTPMILQSIYGGTILLIAGTILGGIWAAESWGRFWDWDPKESWAFISSCFYLICIHAYRFHHIGSFGLAFGAVCGFLAISFTWYGVNYLLGSGLHSYGFGSGGEFYYYAFFGAECLFLMTALVIKTLKRNLKKHKIPHRS